MDRKKNYNIKVYTIAGKYVRTLSTGVVMTGVSFSAQLDGGQGEARIRLAIPFNTTLIAYNNIIRIYESDDANPTGRIIYTGIVGSLNRANDNWAEYVEIRAVGIASMLSWDYYDQTGPSYAFNKNQEAATTLKDIVNRFATKYQTYPTNGLVAYYPMNGNANDESGNAYNGTVAGAVLTTDRFGAANRAYSFDGVNDSITIGDVLDIGLSDFSFGGWFNTTTAGAFQSIVSKSRAAGANGRFGVMFTWGELYSFIDFDAPANIWKVSIPEGPYIDGNWHLATVTIKRNGNLTLYVDGINKGTVNISAHVATNHVSTDLLGIGAYNNAAGTALTQGWFNGKIGTVSLYNRALTQEEIEQMYIGGLITYTSTSIETSGVTVNQDFSYNKALESIKKTASATEYWWTIDGNGVLQFHPRTGAAGQIHHKVDIGKQVDSLQVEENLEKLINRYILTYSAGTVTANDTTSQTAYGIREFKEDRTDITDVTTANSTAAAYIAKNKDPKRKISLIINNNYDIETIKPGDLMTVRNVDLDISTLQISKIEYNPDNIKVSLEDFNSLFDEISTT